MRAVLLATQDRPADTASMKEFGSVEPKIEQLPEDTENVLVDTGYDKNAFADRIGCEEQGHRTGRRFLWPPNQQRRRASLLVPGEIQAAQVPLVVGCPARVCFLGSQGQPKTVSQTPDTKGLLSCIDTCTKQW